MRVLAYMRRWAFDGIDVMAIKKREDRPRGWSLYATTETNLQPDDVPLVDGRAVAELVEIAKKFDAMYQPEAVGHMDDREPDAQGIFGVNRATITLGDLRRLRAALAPFKEADGV